MEAGFISPRKRTPSPRLRQAEQWRNPAQQVKPDDSSGLLEAHNGWLQVQLARQSLRADTASQQVAALQSQQQQMHEMIQQLEEEVLRLQDASRTADAWEEGVERLMQQLSRKERRQHLHKHQEPAVWKFRHKPAACEQQQQEQQEQQRQSPAACDSLLPSAEPHQLETNAEIELQQARRQMHLQSKKLKAARQHIQEQKTEVGASTAAATAAWEMYEGLIQQLVPLVAKAAEAVSLLNRSDINWLDATGTSKEYKAGVLQGAKVLAALAKLPHAMQQQLRLKADASSAAAGCSSDQPDDPAACSQAAAAAAAAGAAAAKVAVATLESAAEAARAALSNLQLHDGHSEGESMLSTLAASRDAATGHSSPRSPRLRLNSVKHRRLRMAAAHANDFEDYASGDSCNST